MHKWRSFFFCFEWTFVVTDVDTSPHISIYSTEREDSVYVCVRGEEKKTKKGVNVNKEIQNQVDRQQIETGEEIDVFVTSSTSYTDTRILGSQRIHASFFSLSLSYPLSIFQTRVRVRAWMSNRQSKVKLKNSPEYKLINQQCITSCRTRSTTLDLLLKHSR